MKQHTKTYILLLSISVTLPAMAQIAPETEPLRLNFVRTWEPLVPLTDTALTATKPVEEVRTTTAYLDGLGRPLQMVAKQQSPGKKDMVSPIVYDGLGREARKYLPFASVASANNVNGTNDGLYKTDALAQQTAFMQAQYGAPTGSGGQGESFFYSQKVFEPSPLNRPVKSFAPGNSWAGTMGTHAERAVQLQYRLNTAADSVRIWATAANPATLPASSEVYGQGQLSKTITIDEQGRQVVEYKDNAGLVILKKVQLANAPAAGHTGWLCTYYVYDDMGRLTTVLPPLAVDQLISTGWMLTATLSDELCFGYTYDQRGRMITKKVPGAATVNMVYDVRDRLVMTQDGKQATTGQWMVTQYDELNRPLRTYLWAGAGTAAYHRQQAYISSAYPAPAALAGADLLTETYYDNYNWVAGSGTTLTAVLDAANTSNSSYFITTYNTSPLYAQPITASYALKGQATGSKVKVLNTVNTYLYTVSFYDERGRAIQVQSINASGGRDILTTQYDFSGKPLRLLQQHSKAGTNAASVTILTKMAYDHGGRLLTVKKTIQGTVNSVAVSSLEKTILTNTYDELGQLRKKELGIVGLGIGNPLESLVYDYNIRGWLLGTNRDYVKGTANNWFGFELGYDKAGAIVPGTVYTSPQYNGNIGGTTWRAAGDGEKRKYDFAYDNVNRLTGADFNQYTINKFDKDAGIDYSVSNLTFDANGNILSMAQKGWRIGGSDFVDKLKYNYQLTSNKLISVHDTANDNSSRLGDFKYNAATKTSTDYTYDVNGNMVVDNNKSISSITYNYLNLPQSIAVSNKGSIDYVYDATGSKLKKIVHETGKPDKTTEYVSGFVYQDSVLEFTGHEEGRIRYAKQYFVNGDSAMTWQYDYFLKDHLGNIRTVLTEQTDTAKYMATFETAARVKETALYTRISETAYPIASIVSPDYPADPTTSPNTYTSKLDGIANQLGATLALKVMVGDKVDIGVKAWVPYAADAPNTSNIQPEKLLSGLIAALTNGSAGLSGGKATPAELQGSSSPMLGGINSFLSSHTDVVLPSPPKAYLNWILFDEQFNYVPSGSGFIRVGYHQDRRLQTLATSGLPVTKSGYLFVYLSYQAKMADGEKPVFFDNLVVQHYTGPLTEENVYYPFGLQMAGISSKATGRIENKYKYNGIEQENFFDINIGETFFRTHDAQIGRWWQADPKSEYFFGLTPYNCMGNSPVKFNDPRGDRFDDESLGYIETMEDMVQERQNQLRADIISLKKDIVDANAGGDKKMSKLLNGQLQTSKFMFSEMSNSLREISELKKSKQLITVRSFASGEGKFGGRISGITKYSQDDKAVAIGFVFGDYTSLIHELKHAYQFIAGEMSFYPTKMDINKADDYSLGSPVRSSLYDLNDELTAYKRDYSFFPSSQIFSGFQDITPDNLSQGHPFLPCENLSMKNTPVNKNEVAFKTHKN